MKPLKGYGLFMYNLCEKTGVYFSKHLWLYWVLMFTWALPTTLIGLLVTLFLLIAGKRPKRYGHAYRFLVGKHWGGLSLGLMFIQDKTEGKSVARHEYGHLHQLILGPFSLFLCSIPSAIRYWYMELSKRTDLSPYEQIWFERSATNLGELIVNGHRYYVIVD